MTRTSNKICHLLLLALPFISLGFQQAATRRTRTKTSSSPAGAAAAFLLNRHPRPAYTRHQAFALDTVESSIDTFFQTQPYVAAFLTCSFKASAADYVAQIRQFNNNDEAESSSPPSTTPPAITVAAASSSSTDDTTTSSSNAASVDLSRNLGFLVYGGLYQGMFQEFLYGIMFPQWFTDNSWTTIATQVGIDMTIVTPLLCLPMAYIFKAAFASSSESLNDDEETPPPLLERGLTKYVADVKERGLLFKYWSLWIPVQTLTFGFIPHHYRIAFIACVSFVWMFILSTVSSEADSEQQQQQQQQIIPASSSTTTMTTSSTASTDATASQSSY